MACRLSHSPDRGNLFGLVKFYKACREAGVKPIIGAELDYEDADGGASVGCKVLVASKTGYANLLAPGFAVPIPIPPCDQAATKG